MNGTVIYWPSIEPSIKRCTCVNKRRNSGSGWTLGNNISRCPRGSDSVETRNPKGEPAFGPSVTHSWATPAKLRKKCYYGQEKNSGQYISRSPVSTHLSHTTEHHPFGNKVWGIYIFVKKCVFIRLLKSSLLMTMFFPPIYAKYLYMYMCSCTVAIQKNTLSAHTCLIINQIGKYWKIE